MDILLFSRRIGAQCMLHAVAKLRKYALRNVGGILCYKIYTDAL